MGEGIYVGTALDQVNDNKVSKSRTTAVRRKGAKLIKVRFLRQGRMQQYRFQTNTDPRSPLKYRRWTGARLLGSSFSIPKYAAEVSRGAWNIL